MSGYFSNKAEQAQREDEIQFLNDRLNEIENKLFVHSKEKLDPYTKSILVAHLVENQKNLDEMKFYVSQEVKGIVKHNYDGSLKPLSAFMLRWGWTFAVFLMSLLLMIAWWLFEIRSKYETVQQKSLEQEVIEKVVKYDKTENQYYIDAKDYTVENSKNGGFKGIIIKSKSNESNN